MVASSRTVEIARKPEFLEKAKHLSKINNWKAAWAIARQWVVIAACATAAIWSGHWLVYAVAIVVIATRQHALGVLLHDASHYRVFTNRQANEFVSNVACALPVAVIVSRYRAEHTLHHRHSNTEKDPYWLIFQSNPRDWRWPKRPLSALTVLVKDFFGLNSHVATREFSNWSPAKNHFGESGSPVPLSRGDRATAYLFVASLIVALWLTNGWVNFAILWILPFLTISQFLVRVRTIAEHHGLPEDSGTDATRHVDPSFWEALSIAPLNVNCHLVHHIFPSIPQYNLPEMTNILFADPEFAAVAHRSSGYLSRDGVIRGELLAT